MFLHQKIEIVEMEVVKGGTIYYRNCDILAFHIISANAFGSSLPPLFKTYSDIYFSMPPEQISSMFFLNVFEYKVWIFVWLSIAMAIILLLVLKILKNLSWDACTKYVLNIFGISTENTDNNLKSIELGQCVISIFMFLISSCFSCFLIVYLTTSKVKLPFSSISELFQQDEYTIYANPISHNIMALIGMNFDMKKIKFEENMQHERINITKVLCEMKKTVYIIDSFE